MTVSDWLHDWLRLSVGEAHLQGGGELNRSLPRERSVLQPTRLLFCTPGSGGRVRIRTQSGRQQSLHCVQHCSRWRRPASSAYSGAAGAGLTPPGSTPRPSGPAAARHAAHPPWRPARQAPRHPWQPAPPPQPSVFLLLCPVVAGRCWRGCLLDRHGTCAAQGVRGASIGGRRRGGGTHLERSGAAAVVMCNSEPRLGSARG